MIRKAIEKIEEMVRPTTVEIEGRNYSTVPVHSCHAPLVSPVTMHTLTGLIDFYEDQIGTVFNGVIQVLDPFSVAIVSELDAQWNIRQTMAVSSLYKKLSFGFGQFMSIETMMIELQSKFVRDENLKEVVDTISKVHRTAVSTCEDDGTAQKVTFKNEIGRLDYKKIDPIVTLCPYRVFSEINQPASDFLLRFRGGDEKNLPDVALFEADGGHWQNTAIHLIAEYLRRDERLKALDAVIVA